MVASVADLQVEHACFISDHHRSLLTHRWTHVG